MAPRSSPCSLIFSFPSTSCSRCSYTGSNLPFSASLSATASSFLVFACFDDSFHISSSALSLAFSSSILVFSFLADSFNRSTSVFHSAFSSSILVFSILADSFNASSSALHLALSSSIFALSRFANLIHASFTMIESGLLLLKPRNGFLQLHLHLSSIQRIAQQSVELSSKLRYFRFQLIPLGQLWVCGFQLVPELLDRLLQPLDLLHSSMRYQARSEAWLAS